MTTTVRILVSLMLLAAAPACTRTSPSAESATSQTPLTEAEKVETIVLELPHWLTTAVGYGTGAQPFAADEFDEYELAAIKLQSFSAADVRAGIELAISDSNTATREAAFADVFVLLRIMFAVPTTIARTSLQIASPYAVFAASSTSTSYPLRWPVTLGTQNVVTGISNFMTVFGGQYDPLAEYDWLKVKYGNRALPSCVNRCGGYDASKVCQCDPACTSYGDCCVDYSFTCGTSCEGRCGEYDSGAVCQCDESCSAYGDCCADLGTYCGESLSSGEPSEATATARARPENQPLPERSRRSRRR